jgi:3-oxoacyl-[acyl-carrier protein] reductase
MKRLVNRVAIITGASGGLGRATAIRFAQEGALLCLSDIVSTNEILSLVRAEGASAIGVSTDVTDSQSIQQMVDATINAFGKIEILVNIAGISSHGASDDVDEALWEKVIRTNLTSVFLNCKAVLPQMRANGYGRIINMSSILAKNGGNPRPWIDATEQKKAGNLAYGASKAGVLGLTFFLAKENASHGITVNAIAPGPIATHMTRNFPQPLKDQIPVGRMGNADEVADAVAFLAGDTAGFITGEVLDINGGAFTD